MLAVRCTQNAQGKRFQRSRFGAQFAQALIEDMKPRLHTVRFGELVDIGKFNFVHVENGNTVVWDSLRQITIHEIIMMIEK